MCLARAGAQVPSASSLIDSYIERWADFYPSEAFAYGDTQRAASFERYTRERVQRWLEFNHSTSRLAAKALSQPPEGSAGTDLRVLKAQADNELAQWSENQPATHQPQWYAEQISQALTSLLVREQLDPQSRSDALQARLTGVAQLARDARSQLIGGNVWRTGRARRTLAGVAAFYRDSLPDLVADWPAPGSGASIEVAIADALDAITALDSFLEQEILPKADASVSIGADVYATKLSRRTAGAYNPDKLRAVALEEVRETRRLMIDQTRRWHAQAGVKTSDDKSANDLSDKHVLDVGLEAMEAARDSNSADFLASFQRLTRAAELFVEEQQIATVPKPTTLYVQLSPAHFSGAAVGGVYPSGPFDPGADTLFYVPSVPDSAPADAKEGFYRSFNTHFNTMIISHEMFPGHYLQYKVAVAQAPALRSLFPSGSYVEGWGSFVEELMLDAGWADNAPLTRLAHLRKRLENATRAYVSVQVNTAGWGQDEVLAFARDEGLLAPQFAENLWQRVVNTPMQITDYMTGYLEFKRLFAQYQAHARDNSESDKTVALKPWVDAVLRAGPLPFMLLETALSPLHNPVGD
ncbi:MAG: DUF885 domain-containing protein [Congregibacter sp.]